MSWKKVYLLKIHVAKFPAIRSLTKRQKSGDTDFEEEKLY